MAKARKPAKAVRTAKSAQSAAPADRAIDAALSLAAEAGWRHTTLADIAEAAKLSLAELYGLYRSKQSILSAFVRRIDRAVLASGPAEGAAPRDRLFDVLMRRFEALQPYRAGVEAIVRDSGFDPLSALCGGPRLLRSMAWMLETAGLESQGFAGAARTKGLAVVYLATMRVWLGDDTADLSRTLAALDKRLGRAETLANFCRSLKQRRGHGEASEARAS